MKKLRVIAAAIVLLTAAAAGAFAAGQADSSASARAETRPTLKFMSGYVSWDPNADASAEVLQRLTGYKIEYYTLPADNALQKLLLELSSGVSYDFMKVGPPDFQILAGKNVLTPLGDLIEKFAPNIRRVLDPKLDYWQSATLDGKILALPGEQPRNDHGLAIGVNSDYLAKVGAKLPTTLDEYYALSKTLKEKLGVTPLTGGGYMVPIIAGAFNVSNLLFTIEDGKIVAGVKQKRMKEYLSYMAKLYGEGLIDVEWPVNKDAIIKEKFVTGKAAMRYFGWWELPGPLDAIKKSFPAAEILYIRPLVGPAGEQMIDVPRRPENYTIIPRTSQYPEHTMRMLNEMYDPAKFAEIVLGVDGVHYELRSDNQYWPIQPAFANERTNTHWYYSPIPGLDFTRKWQARVKKDPHLYAAYLYMDQVPESIKVSEPTAFAGGLENVAKFRQSCGQLFSDWAITVIAGAASMDTYDAIIREWERSGGAQMEQEVQAWWATVRK